MKRTRREARKTGQGKDKRRDIEHNGVDKDKDHDKDKEKDEGQAKTRRRQVHGQTKTGQQRDDDKTTTNGGL